VKSICRAFGIDAAALDSVFGAQRIGQVAKGDWTTA
jgi:hypothetical protein